MKVTEPQARETDFLEVRTDTETNAPEAQPIEETSADYVKIPLKRAQFALVFIGLLFAIFLTALDQSIATTAFKSIVEDFGHQDLVSWIGTAYLLTSASSGALYGKMSDIFGRKWILVFAICMFELGSLICGVSNSMFSLIIGRAVAGLGGGGIFSLVLILFTDIVSMRDRGKYQGMIGGISGIATIIAPLIGGAITDTGNWRWCFLINLPFGVVTLVTIITFLSIPSEKGSLRAKFARVDFMGSITLFAAIFCFLTPLQLGGSTWPWNSGQTIGMLVGSLFFLAIFIFVELKIATEPIIPASLFSESSVAGLLAIFAALGCGMISGTYFLSLFFQVVFGATATEGGLASVPLMLGMVFTLILSGIAVSKTGKYMIFFYVGPIVMAIGIGLTSLLNKNSSEVVKVIYLLIFGLGTGTMVQVRALAIQASVPKNLVAIATAAGITFNILGGAFGIAIAGTIFNNVVARSISRATELQEFITKFSSSGIYVDSTDVLQILNLLQSSAQNYPNSTTEAAIYNSTLEKATSELLDGFIQAFNLTYLCLLAIPGVILIAAIFFVKQFDIGAGGKHP
ncbi:hypothetical protein HK100_005734 [Physocladia obscura]|uniref:Major facilitator superfamily (MFS) profile domain-containing protein n=1 Tax=Physocladia obscura TaxID=109957 RepID=A0AAD5XIS2_9FUNG|nr:hypothetical protein HK100_005734 [Physocladia obscura]